MARTDLANIEAQLAEKAKDFNKQIAAPQGRKLVINQQNGNIMAPGDINLGTEVKLIVVDFCSANRFYPGQYDPNNIVPPVCFAFGDIIDEMAPEAEAPEPQSDACKTCPHNQWGSSGRGKACKNTRELAVVLVDELEDPDYDPELYHLSVSPSSIKFFDGIAGKINALFNGPPIKAIITMSSVANKNYYESHFGSPEANPYLERVFPLMELAPDLIARTPDLSNYKPTPKARTNVRR